MKVLARAGGEAILRAQPADAVATKEGRGNFVTAADLASEREILRLLGSQFPVDEVLTEESRPVANGSTAAHLWVIDPLDGTANFRYGRKYVAVSVAYVEAGVTCAGAVYDPYRDETFFAARGEGATLNGERIRPSDVRCLASASLATDNCYDPDGTRHNLELCLRIQPSPWIMVRGSAVLSMCEVACGRTDLYFHTALQPWDNAAAFLITREAGGRIVGMDGADVDFFTSSAILGNAELVEQCWRSFRLV